MTPLPATTGQHKKVQEWQGYQQPTERNADGREAPPNRGAFLLHEHGSRPGSQRAASSAGYLYLSKVMSSPDPDVSGSHLWG